MSTQKIDPVVEELKKYVEMNDDDAGKFMLYANPNGSGLLNEKAPLLPVMKAKFAMAAQTGTFDYEGLELPVSAVGIQVRVRHTIHELLQLFEIANIMRAHLYVASAKGQIWPVPPPTMPGQNTENNESSKKKTSMKIPVIKGVKSAIKEELVKNLPTIIDLCYTAKFRSSGTFAYSLAETKLYSVRKPFLSACFNWIYQVLQIGSGRPEDLILGTAGARENLLYEDWYAYSYTKSRDSHKYPQHTDKLFRAVCARVGKLLYTPAGSEEYYPAGTNSAEKLLAELVFQRTSDMKKKTLQKELYKHLLLAVQRSHESASETTSSEAAYKSAVVASIDYVLNILISHVDGLGIERSLVFLDVFEQRDGQFKKAGYTNAEFVTIAQTLSATGACNERVMNALYKFISVFSLLNNNGHSRKYLDPSIEDTLVQYADLTKIKPGTPEPNIVFSQRALSMMSEKMREKFGGLRDAKVPGATGYVQKGVMSMTSALKDEAPISSTVNETDYKLRGNQLNELANIFDDISQPALKKQKDIVKTINRDKKLREKYGVGGASPYQVMGNAFVPLAQSPAMMQQQIFGGVESKSDQQVVAQEHHLHQHPSYNVPDVGLVNQHQTNPEIVHSLSQPGSMFGAPLPQSNLNLGQGLSPSKSQPGGLFAQPLSQSNLNLGSGLSLSPNKSQAGGLFSQPLSQPSFSLGGGLSPPSATKAQGGLFGQPLSQPNLGGGSPLKSLGGKSSGGKSPLSMGSSIFDQK